MYHSFHTNIQRFLSSKSEYYYDFWRSCDTEDWSNDAENTDLITEIKCILQYIHLFLCILIKLMQSWWVTET